MSGDIIAGPMKDEQMLRLLKEGKTFKITGSNTNDLKAQLGRLGFADAYRMRQIGNAVELRLPPPSLG